MNEQQDEIARLKDSIKMLGKVIHDMTVGNQAAWIEWQHGAGAEAAMGWIHNGLAGPGLIPDEDEPWGKEAQAWYSANCADPMPTCHCGRPSSIGWMGQGFCSNEHYNAARALPQVAPTEPDPFKRKDGETASDYLKRQHKESGK